VHQHRKPASREGEREKESEGIIGMFVKCSSVPVFAVWLFTLVLSAIEVCRKQSNGRSCNTEIGLRSYERQNETRIKILKKLYNVDADDDADVTNV
jgi:hypothetical protein